MSTIHCSCEAEAPRSRWSVGRATLRIVLSSPITSSDRERTASVHQRRGSAASAAETRLFRFIMMRWYGIEFRNASVSFRYSALDAHHLEVAPADPPQRGELVVVPMPVRRAGDEPG